MARGGAEELLWWVSGCGVLRIMPGPKKMDMVGRVFGLWTVLREAPRKGPDIRWHCRCECGYEGIRSGVVLRKGQTTRCTKCRDKVQQLRWQAELGDTTLRLMLASARKRAGIKGWDYALDAEYVKRLLVAQGYRCALSGRPICVAPTGRSHRHGNSTASIDRIDSSLGYVPGNIQWLHKEINYIKATMGQEYFISVCREIVDHAGSGQENNDEN